MMRFRITVFVGLCALATPAAAQPTTMTYQGSLSDADGIPVDQTVSMTFSIFDVETGGAAALWTETQDVDVVNGFFSILLGENDPLDESLFPANADRWLAISVEGAALSPRQALGSAPWALVCGDAQTVGGMPAGSFGDISSVTSPLGTLTGGSLAGDVTLDVNYALMGACADPTYDKVVGINADGTVQCQAELLAPGVPGDITAVLPGVGLTGGGNIGAVTLDLVVPVTAPLGGTGLTFTFGFGDTYLRSDGVGGWFESNLDGNGLIPGTVALDKLGPGFCASDQYLRFDGFTWVCSPLFGSGFVDGSIGADKINLQAQTGTTSGILAASVDNFFFAVGALFGTNIAPTTSDVCMVTADVEFISAAPNTGLGPFFRIAVNDGINPSGNDNNFGHYPGELTAAASSYRQHMSRTSIVPISPGFNYSFGCYLGFPEIDWDGDTVNCQVAYTCF